MKKIAADRNYRLIKIAHDQIHPDALSYGDLYDRYYAACHKCKWYDEAGSLAAARERADEHDRLRHKGRPVSSFGEQEIQGARSEKSPWYIRPWRRRKSKMDFPEGSHGYPEIPKDYIDPTLSKVDMYDMIYSEDDENIFLR